MLALAALMFWRTGRHKQLRPRHSEDPDAEIQLFSRSMQQQLLVDLQRFVCNTRTREEAAIRLGQLMLLIPNVQVSLLSKKQLQHMTQELRDALLLSTATGVYRCLIRRGN